MQNVIIIGSGPAGLTASIYSARAKLKPILISGLEDKINQLYTGGQLVLSDAVENFPGFPNPVSGKVLTQDLMMSQAIKYGTKILHEEVLKIETTNENKSIIITNKRRIETRTVIIATGAGSNWLHLANEEKFMNFGVSTCAVCDATEALNDKHIVVVGGGDSALQDALYLTIYSNNVTIIHRRDSFRASKILQERVLTNKDIKVIWNSEVIEYRGKERLEEILIKNKVSSEITTIPLMALFIAIGHTPNTNFLMDSGIELDTNGYIITKLNVFTNKEGVYACGDVHDTRYKQAITASGFGCMAALEAEKWINENGLYEKNINEIINQSESTKFVPLISYEEFLENLKTESKPIFLDVVQTVCPLCEAFAPVLGSLIDKYPEIKFLSLNIDKLSSDNFDEFEDTFTSVFQTPTFIFIENGKFSKKFLPGNIKEVTKVEEIIKNDLKK